MHSSLTAGHDVGITIKYSELLGEHSAKNSFNHTGGDSAVTRESVILGLISGDDPVIEEVQQWISFVNGLFLIPLMTLLGVPGNIVIAVVFYKQGLRERINLCLFALAIVDLIALLGLFLPNFEIQIRELFLVNSWTLAKISPNLVGFVWASQFLSAVIASERCFCVVSPFHAKRLLKTSTMAAIIVVCCILLIGGMCAIAGPKYTVVDFFDPLTNTTEQVYYVTRYYLDNRDILDVVDIYVYATFLSGFFLLVIAITTFITVIALRSAMSQRKSMTMTDSTVTSSKFTGQLSSKELTVTRMLIGTSVLFIFCWTPNFVVQVIKLISKHDFSSKSFHSLLFAFNSFFRVVNTSTTVLLYYVVGTKFRQSLHALCTCHPITRLERSHVSVNSD